MTAADAIPAEYLDEFGGDSRPPAYWELDGKIVGPDTALLSPDYERAIMVIRASALGHCIWELAAHLQGHTPLPYPEVVLRRFREGHDGEPLILDRLFSPEMRWERVEGAAQAQGELKVGPGRVIRFHPDDVGISSREPDNPRLVEVKFLAHDGWDQAHKKGPETLPYGYDWQLSAMMHALKLPALWLLGEKVRKPGSDKAGAEYVPPEVGNLAMRYVDKPPRSLAEIMRRVKEIYDVATGEDLTTIDRPCDRPDLWPCLFRHLRPEPEGGEEAALPDIAEELKVEADRLMSGYIRFRDIEARAKKDKEALRDQLKAMFGDSAGTTGTHNYRTIPTPKREMDKKAVSAVLAEHEIDLDDYITETWGSRVDIQPVKQAKS